MSWYRAGSVTVAAGSNVVTGAGTDFVANASIGDAFVGQDGRSYEIGQIVSATDLRLATPYQGAGGGGQAYAIQPTQSFARDLALAAAALLGTFAAVRDGVGQGLFPAGTVAAPGVRGVGDQDTGLRWPNNNVLALVTGGVDRATVDEQGRVGIGTSAASAKLEVYSPSDANGLRVVVGGGAYAGNVVLFGVDGQSNGYQMTKDAANNILHIFSGTGGAERARIDSAGNFLVGVPSGTSHVVARGGAANGAPIVAFQQAGAVQPMAIYAIDFNGVEGANSANAAMKVGRSSTGRSIAASGTINASGADYAEYMLKAAGCGIIAKGDVCGVDRDGKLTKAWADAISFVVKSTDPSLVGGDTWAAHLPPRPEQEEDEADEAFAAREAEWSAALEQARICVDRIAFCGQVPCNVTGDFEVGDYIVAAASGAGIKAVAMKLDDMTMAQYARRIGKVWAVRDGRAWIDVQHG